MHFPILLLASFLVSNVWAYPTGAPICKISPASYNFLLTAVGTTGTAPMGQYNESLAVSIETPTNYTLGSDPVAINITGSWAGILLFAENADGYHVGEFETPINYRYVVGADCKTRNDKATLTHSTNSKKTGVTTFMWTPPTVYEGDLTFKCLIVGGSLQGFRALNSTQVSAVAVSTTNSATTTDPSGGPVFWEFATVGMALVASIWSLGV